MEPKSPLKSAINALAVLAIVIAGVLDAYGALLPEAVIPWLEQTADYMIPALILAARTFRSNQPTTWAPAASSAKVANVGLVLLVALLLAACTASFTASRSMEWRPTVGPPGAAELYVDGEKVCEASGPGPLVVRVDACGKVIHSPTGQVCQDPAATSSGSAP